MPARDVAVFSLGLLPDGAKGRHRAEDIAARLRAAVGGNRMRYEEAARLAGVHPAFKVRYAAATGTVLLRWEGARQPVVWTGPPPETPAAAARLLPSGDAYFLLQGTDRELLVPDAPRRAELWTSRVWPGAVVVGGEVAGTWRRAGALVTVQAFRELDPAERDAVAAEAESLPLPALRRGITVQWG